MFENVFGFFGLIFIIDVGTYLWSRPAKVAEKIKLFYSGYPLIRCARDRQLTSRPGLVRLVGVVLIILGVIGLFSGFYGF